MCLIAVAETAALSHDEIEDAARYNADGIGVAYREPGDRLVSYQKGLHVGEAQFLADKMPLPYVMHFRMATHGGTSPLLCHPFPVTRSVGVRLEGRARELLFHNGVWMEHTMFQHQVRFTGPVSDTRILAYVLWREGQDEREGVATQLASQAGRLALFTKDGIARYGEWEAGTGTDGTVGCWYSNLHHTWTCATQTWDSQRAALSFPTNSIKRPAPGWSSMSQDAWDYDHIIRDPAYPEEVVIELDEETPGTFACGGCDQVKDVCDKEPYALVDGFEVCHTCWAQLT